MNKGTPADPRREAHFADLMDLHTACFVNEGEDAEEALGRMRELIKSRRTALVTKSAETPAPGPEWPQKRDLAASIRVSQQRYEIDVMWNNAIDLCRAALATKPAETAEMVPKKEAIRMWLAEMGDPEAIAALERVEPPAPKPPTLEQFISALDAYGWHDYADAQHERIAELHGKLFATPSIAQRGAPEPPYSDEPEQDEVLRKFESAGFRYDGQSLWKASLYTEELLALGRVLAQRGAALTDEQIVRLWLRMKPASTNIGIEAAYTEEQIENRAKVIAFVRAALTHRSADPASGHPAQAVASSSEAAYIDRAGVIEKIEEALPKVGEPEAWCMLHATDLRWIKYELEETQRSSSGAGSDEAKPGQGAPLGSEPVAWMCEERNGLRSDIWETRVDTARPVEGRMVRNVRPLYASPPAGEKE